MISLTDLLAETIDGWEGWGLRAVARNAVDVVGPDGIWILVIQHGPKITVSGKVEVAEINLADPKCKPINALTRAIAKGWL